MSLDFNFMYLHLTSVIRPTDLDLGFKFVLDLTIFTYKSIMYFVSYFTVTKSVHFITYLSDKTQFSLVFIL